MLPLAFSLAGHVAARRLLTALRPQTATPRGTRRSRLAFAQKGGGSYRGAAVQSGGATLLKVGAPVASSHRPGNRPGPAKQGRRYRQPLAAMLSGAIESVKKSVGALFTKSSSTTSSTTASSTTARSWRHVRLRRHRLCGTECRRALAKRPSTASRASGRRARREAFGTETARIASPSATLLKVPTYPGGV